MAHIESVKSLLERDLCIPSYQRPYKWADKNIADLLTDINNALETAKKYPKFKYRIGSVILHKDIKNGPQKWNIVDGQQRIISIILICLYLDRGFTCSLLKRKFQNKISQENIKKNYSFIKNWFSMKNPEVGTAFKKAFESILEVVTISVERESEAFQLFDSQNTRGKPLDPHDLLKAYHLREMQNNPYEMQHAVTKWEAVESKEIKELFETYLFPIQHWVNLEKSHTFSVQDIDSYKGISESLQYTYAKRVDKAMPYFQIAEPFTAGNCFFNMVEHYLQMLKDIKSEIRMNKVFFRIKKILDLDFPKKHSIGFRHTSNLFFCTFLCFYDRFKCFDVQVVQKLFSWAFMLRVDMERLGFDSVNKYAIGGEDEQKYSNHICVFKKIIRARLHNEIANIHVEINEGSAESQDGKNINAERKEIYSILKSFNTQI